MWIDRRILGGVAIASLLGNVFLVGIVVGGLTPLRHAAGVGRPFFGGTFVRPAAVRQLPTDQRRAFAAAMSVHRPAIHDARMAVRDRRREAEADIAATTFDRGKIADDLARLRTANTALLVQLHAGLIDALAVLPADGRARLADPHRRLNADRPAPEPGNGLASPPSQGSDEQPR